MPSLEVRIFAFITDFMHAGVSSVLLDKYVLRIFNLLNLINVEVFSSSESSSHPIVLIKHILHELANNHTIVWVFKQNN